MLMAHISYVLIMSILSFLSAFGVEVEKSTTPAVSLEEKEIIIKPEPAVAPTSLKSLDGHGKASNFAKASMDRLEGREKVIVNNTIVQKDLGYYKFFMTHYPADFTIQVNGKKLESKEQLIVEEPRLTIVYSYEWSTPLGRVKKSKTLVYDIDPKTEKIDLSFTSWKEDEPRIKAPGCSLVQVTEVEEANTIPKDKVNQFMAQANQK
jgi:hypothetical protein